MSDCIETSSIFYFFLGFFATIGVGTVLIVICERPLTYLSRKWQTYLLRQDSEE